MRVALLSLLFLTACGESVVFTSQQASMIQMQCAANGGVITRTHTTTSGMPYSFTCDAVKGKPQN